MGAGTPPSAIRVFGGCRWVIRPFFSLCLRLNSYLFERCFPVVWPLFPCYSPVVPAQFSGRLRLLPVLGPVPNCSRSRSPLAIRIFHFRILGGKNEGASRVRGDRPGMADQLFFFARFLVVPVFFALCLFVVAPLFFRSSRPK